MDTICRALVKPYGMGEFPLVLLSEPTFSRAEQGGFRDAQLRAAVDPTLANRLRLAEVEIQTPYGTKWFGHVRDVDGDTLTCQGSQARLDETRMAAAYRMGIEHWEVFDGKRSVPQASAEVLESGTLKTVFDNEEIKADRGAYYVCHLPAPCASVKVDWTSNFEYVSATWAVTLYYATNYGTSWQEKRTVTTNASFSDTITDTNITSVMFKAYATATVTPPADRTTTITPIVYGTSVTDATAAKIATHLLGLAGRSFIDVDAALTTAIDDLVFGPETTPLTAFAELLKYGDWRFYVAPRLDGSTYKPCDVFAPRATTPIYDLTEGNGVTCDLAGESAEPLASVVRVEYSDRYGRQRYVDVTDTDESHYLVQAGITKYAHMTVDTRSSYLANLAGTRYLVDAGRDQVQGTVTVEGSPAGVPACNYEPGELLRLTTRDRGVVVARITEATYEGAHKVTLALDNTPNTEDALARAIAAFRHRRSHVLRRH